MGTAETMNDVRPYRTTRSLARTGAQINEGHELRRAPTDTERAAWCLLRSIKFKGFKFRRQDPLGPYIVDFYCAQRRPSEKDGVQGAAVLERHPPGGAGIICAKNPRRRVVATGSVWIRRSDRDPLTRLAPADEGAGCDPPSPPRGRGLGILEIERLANVETLDRRRVSGRKRERAPALQNAPSLPAQIVGAGRAVEHLRKAV